MDIQYNFSDLIKIESTVDTKKDNRKGFKIIKCFCGELIELPGNHMLWCRGDHTFLNGFTRMLFQRMSGKYQIMYERPER